MKSRVVKTLVLGFFIFSALGLPLGALAASGSLNVSQPILGNSPPNNNGGGGGTGTEPNQIYNVSVEAKSDSAIVSWHTSIVSLVRVLWGRNSEYSDGQVSTEQFAKEDSAFIPDLKPGTDYYYQIVAMDPYGRSVYYSGRFSTTIAPDTTPPSNVSNLVATPLGDRISLSWTAPPEKDFEAVRVVRSDKFFPLDPFNGQVIYEGNHVSTEDNTANPGVIYYYTVFSRDQAGNYSSGSLATAMILWYSENSGQVRTPVVDTEFVPAGIKPIRPTELKDFTFTYDHGIHSTNPLNAVIPELTGLTLSIPLKNLPQDTSSLIISVKSLDLAGPEFMYLFSLNKDSQSFEVTLPNFPAGSYSYTINIFDASKRVIQTVGGKFEVRKKPAQTFETGGNEGGRASDYQKFLIITAVSSTILLIIGILLIFLL